MKTAEPNCLGSAVEFNLGDSRNQPLVLPDIGHAPQPDFLTPLTAPGDAAAGAVLSQVAALLSLQLAADLSAQHPDLPLTAPGAVVVVVVLAHAASERRRMLPVICAKRFMIDSFGCELDVLGDVKNDYRWTKYIGSTLNVI